MLWPSLRPSGAPGQEVVCSWKRAGQLFSAPQEMSLTEEHFGEELVLGGPGQVPAGQQGWPARGGNEFLLTHICAHTQVPAHTHWLPLTHSCTHTRVHAHTHRAREALRPWGGCCPSAQVLAQRAFGSQGLGARGGWPGPRVVVSTVPWDGTFPESPAEACGSSTRPTAWKCLCHGQPTPGSARELGAPWEEAQCGQASWAWSGRPTEELSLAAVSTAGWGLPG